MELLNAVNTVLPALGEHTVTELDPKHPTVQVILNAIQNRLDDALLETWWFNTYDVTLYPSPEGEVALQDGILSILPYDVQASKRGNRLFNLETREYTWPVGVPIRARIAERVSFEQLPESVARMVMYDGLVHAYTTDIGLEQVVQAWRLAASAAASQVLAEHLRNKRYGTTNSPRYKRYRRALRG